MNRAKNPATYFRRLGIQIKKAAAICKTPNMVQIAGEICSCREQGGSKKDKNLSTPIIRNNRLQIPVIILIRFIFNGKGMDQLILE